MLPLHRPPTPPGEMLLEEFLKPRGISQVHLAEQMGVPVQRVNTLVNGKRGVSAETALLLADVLGTTPEFWMGLQADADLWQARRHHRARPALAFGRREQRRGAHPSRRAAGRRPKGSRLTI